MHPPARRRTVTVPLQIRQVRELPSQFTCLFVRSLSLIFLSILSGDTWIHWFGHLRIAVCIAQDKKTFDWVQIILYTKKQKLEIGELC